MKESIDEGSTVWPEFIVWLCTIDIKFFSFSNNEYAFLIMPAEYKDLASK